MQKGGNKHVSIAISVLNDWLPNTFFSPTFDKLATSIQSLVCFYGNLNLRVEFQPHSSLIAAYDKSSRFTRLMYTFTKGALCTCFKIWTIYRQLFLFTSKDKPPLTSHYTTFFSFFILL